MYPPYVRRRKVAVEEHQFHRRKLFHHLTGAEFQIVQNVPLTSIRRLHVVNSNVTELEAGRSDSSPKLDLPKSHLILHSAVRRGGQNLVRRKARNKIRLLR